MLWDASLYKGKYYLYWGPSPALFLAIFKVFSEQEVGDKVITFVFTVGTFIFAALLILELWKKYFLETPPWAVFSAIAFAGLANPILYILIEARIYEAAIIAGQFFIIGGTYWLIHSIQPSIQIAPVTWQGAFLALAVGSRTTLTFSVGFLALMALLWTFKTQRTKILPYIIAFALRFGHRRDELRFIQLCPFRFVH